MKEKLIIGIDIGGTNFRIGAVDRENRVLNFSRRPVSSVLKGGDAIKELAAFIEEYIEYSSFNTLMHLLAFSWTSSSLKNTKYYSAEYKLKVIKRHFEDGISAADLTRETVIQYRMLKRWFQDYQKRGEEGLSTRKRGRPRKPQPNTPEEKIRQLEMENEVLRAFREECERWDAKNSGTK